MKETNQSVTSMVVSIFLGYAGIFITLLGLIFVVFTLRREHFNLKKPEDRKIFGIEIVSIHSVYLNFALGAILSLYISTIKIFDEGILEHGQFFLDWVIRSFLILLIFVNFVNSLLSVYDARYRLITSAICITTICCFIDIERTHELQSLTVLLLGLLLLSIMQVWAIVRLTIPNQNKK